MCADFIKSLTN